jgi:hypothetical protein
MRRPQPNLPRLDDLPTLSERPVLTWPERMALMQRMHERTRRAQQRAKKRGH